MAASQVFALLLVLIFIGFIGLLVSLRQSQSIKPEYDDDDDDDNSNSTDIVVDLSKPFMTRCHACPLKSLRDLFCHNESFVVICRIADVTSIRQQASGPSDWIYAIQLISQLKQFPDVNSSSIGTQSQIGTSLKDDSCDHFLKPGRSYILTGRIMTSGLAVVSSCDVVIDWSAIPVEKQRSLFTFFSPRLRC